MSIKRYSKIIEKYPREFLLLQGTGCIHKKCIFCDYYLDTSRNSFFVNKPVIEKITGEFGVLDITNSGSSMELDSDTLEVLKIKILEKKIKTVWFEAHWLYHRVLEKFSKNFPGVKIKYRIGIETFNSKLRNLWNKGIPEHIKILEISKKFQSVNLIVGIKGQKIEDVERDIEIADRYFERFIINIYTPNTTKIERDSKIIEIFKNKFAKILKKNPKAEILFMNTDFGVG